MDTTNITYFCAMFTIYLIVWLPGAYAGSSEHDAFDAADLDSQHDVVRPGSRQMESNLQQAGSACSEDSDCLHNGTCTERTDGWKACSCRNGTRGSRCETVDECVLNLKICGDEKKARCAYDVDREKAFCRCNDDTKEFDPSVKLCRTPCKRRKGCEPNGYCNYYRHTFRGSYFCECYEGARGDACEIVEQCESGEVDCGVDSGATCRVGEDDPQAYCQCNVTGQGFDYDEKKCKDCNCRKNSRGCEFRNGKQICDCTNGYFDDGSGCTECKCGKGGSSRCLGKDGKKVCDCYTGYSQRLNQCELCDCGPTAANCTFDDAGKKQCSCNPGSVVRKDQCTQMCNSSHGCQNGGTCDVVCQCPEGTSGDFCETVDWCSYDRCGIRGDTTCLYNKTTKRGDCGCKEPKYLYNDKYRRCFVCDCGDHGKCSVVDGGKECTCEKGYAEKDLRCEACDCGPDTISCSYDQSGKKLCQCPEKFAQWTPANSRWNGLDAACEPCDCGEHGRCFFDSGRKVCDCEIKFREFEGKCNECYCGPDGYCYFDDLGGKVCQCDYGFALSPSEGICRDCNCDPYKLRGIGANCSLPQEGRKKCECPDGFRETFGYYCEDIDECLRGPCPGGTNCVNLPGTYRCECKKGFEPVRFGGDPQKYGCMDINECQEENACLSHTTLCVNSQGSYDCVCRDGYYPNSASAGPHYSPKHVTCYVEYTQWHVASIILGLILGSTIISLSCYICLKKNQ